MARKGQSLARQRANVTEAVIASGDDCRHEEMVVALTALVREGARRMLVAALEVEAAIYVEACADERDDQGRPMVRRNGHAKRRTITTAMGDLEIGVPGISDGRIDPDTGERMRFQSAIVPPESGNRPKVAALLPSLYLHGMSTGDFVPAGEELFGSSAALSSPAIARLIHSWQAERASLMERDLSNIDYVSVWADGVCVRVRLEEASRCAIVVAGVQTDDTKELVAIADGSGDSRDSWADVLADLRRRGIRAPVMNVGDGALGESVSEDAVPAQSESGVKVLSPDLAGRAMEPEREDNVTRMTVFSRARRMFRPRRIGFLTAGAALGVLLWHIASVWSIYFLYISCSLVLGVVCWTTLVWMLYAWRTPDSVDQTGLPADDLNAQHSFSLIVPARHEQRVLEATLSRLIETDHPAFEVLVVVGSDDPGTQQVAERVAAAYPKLVKVVIDNGWPKSKPKALNAALPHCRGDITGVFDAEDDVHPALLQRVDESFQKSDADVVQAGVQLMNFRSSWFAVRNVLEYYFWFRSRLHFHARAGFIPLGGNTVFVRTDVLRAVGGWDEECLAEDCELGVRLSSLGAKTVVFYEPELVTREETPSSLRAFARQRTRWNQGYLQTFLRGHWRRLPLKQRALGIYTLAMPSLMALAFLMIPAAVATAIVLKAPIPLTLASFLPVLPLLTVLAVEVVGLGDFCRSYGERASIRDYVRLIFGYPFYAATLAWTSARAVVREARGARGWEKTEHLGLHLARPNQGRTPAQRRLPIPLPAESLYAAFAAVSSTSGSRDFGSVASQGPVRPDQSVCIDTGAPGSAVADGLATFSLVGPLNGASIPEANGRISQASGSIGYTVNGFGRAPLWMRLHDEPTTEASAPEPDPPSGPPRTLDPETSTPPPVGPTVPHNKVAPELVAASATSSGSYWDRTRLLRPSAVSIDPAIGNEGSPQISRSDAAIAPYATPRAARVEPLPAPESSTVTASPAPTGSYWDRTRLKRQSAVSIDPAIGNEGSPQMSRSDAAIAPYVAPRAARVEPLPAPESSTVAASPAPTGSYPDRKRVAVSGAVSVIPASGRYDARTGGTEGIRGLLRRFVRSHPDAAVQLPLLVFVGLVQARNLIHWPANGFDEGTYVGNAWALQTHGALSNYTYGYGHPPLGWLTLSVWTWARGMFGHTIYSIDTERQFMLVISIASCSLLYLLARRLGIGRILAAGAVILFALSPLALYFHRLVYLDNQAVTLALAALVLALSPRRRLWTFAGSGACFAAAVLTKETALLLLPILLLAVAQNLDPRTRRYCLTVLVSLLGLISIAYPLYAALKGELLPGRGHVSFFGEQFTQLFARKASGSPLDPLSQAHGVVQSWLHLDPWLLGAALLLSPFALARRATRWVAIGYIYQIVMLLRPGYLPSMYVIAVLPFAALIVAVSVDMLWRFAVNRSKLRDKASQESSRVMITRAPVWLLPVGRGSAGAALVVLVAVSALVVGPRWTAMDHNAMTARSDSSQLAAEQWLVSHVDHAKRLLVDANFWIYLIAHGYNATPMKGGFYSRTVAFYWPTDYDPAVQRAFPLGWRSFDYVVSTQGMRIDGSQTPTAAHAIEHSRVVVTFGSGAQRIEIREITRAQPSEPPSQAHLFKAATRT